jgi:hypothetical protein
MPVPDDPRSPEARSTVEAELDRRARDASVAGRLFLFVGSAVGTMSLIYLLTDDDAGQMMLGVASLLGLWFGIFLWRHRPPAAGTVDEDPEDRATPDEAMYLPHASIWPFWIGVAAFFVTNGLILGTWFLVPGAVIMLAGISGFIRQTRSRT